MNNIRTIVSLAIGAMSLTGCASVDQAWLAHPLVKPIQVVRQGSDTDAIYRMGRTFQAEGRLAEAVKAYLQVLQVDPRYAEAHNALGVIYSQQRQVELAEHEFQVALQISPKLAHVYNNMGYHLLRNGRLNEALDALGQARALDRDNRAVAANLSAVHAALDQTAETPTPQGAVDTAQADHAESKPAMAQASAAAEVDSSAQAPQEPEPTLSLVSIASNVWELTSRSAPAAAPAPVVVAQATRAQAEPVPSSETRPSGDTRIEIANGNGASGLALQISTQLLTNHGFERPRLTNHKPYNVRTSRIQYVAGAEAAARRLNASLPVDLPLVRVSALEQHTGVRLLVGKDFPSHRSWAQGNARVAHQKFVGGTVPKA